MPSGPGFNLLNTIICGLILFIVPFSNLNAQQVVFKRLTVGDGLNHANIQAITQDAEGFIWIGSSYGLHKYDGYRFELYLHDPEDSTSISSDMITTLQQDPFNAHLLWIGTLRGGLNRFDKKTSTFTRFCDSDPAGKRVSNDFITDLLFTADSCLYIATDDGVDIIRDLTQSVVEINPLHSSDQPDLISQKVRVITFADPSQSELWIGGKSGLAVFDLINQKLLSLPHTMLSKLKDVRDIFIDRQKNLWIGTYGQGLIKFHLSSNELTRYDLNDGLPSNRIRTIFQDDRNRIWVGTNNGIAILNTGSEVSNTIMHRSFDPKSLVHKTVYQIFEDRADVIWICTPLGLNILTPQMRSFKHYYFQPTARNTIIEGTVLKIIADKNNPDILWLGCEYGLSRFDKKNSTFKNYTISTKQQGFNYIRALEIGEDSDLWLGTTLGLVRFNTRTYAKSFYTPDSKNPNSLSHRRIRDLYYNSAGDLKDLWIATDYGLNKFDLNTNTFTHYIPDTTKSNSINSELIRSIYPDPAPNSQILWIGTSNGFCKFELKSETFTQYRFDEKNQTTISSPHVTGFITNDNDSVLYISTDGGGVNVFDIRNETSELYSEQDGLLSNSINDLTFDKNGDLWVITSAGICKIDVTRQKVEVIHNSRYSKGILFNPQTCFSDHNGTLYIGSMDGLSIYDANQVLPDTPLPPLHITSIKVLNQDINIYPFITANKPLELSYRENFVNFSFALLDFASFTKFKYAYQMIGLNQEWIFSNEQNEANFSSLSPGKYTFRVKAGKTESEWFADEIAIDMIIHPPFWATWWFRSIAVIFLLSLPLIYHKMRLKRIQAHSQELQLLVKKLNTEVSERKKAEEKYQQLNTELEDRIHIRTQQLEQTNQELESFAYSVSHDLKAPLRSIEGFSDALTEDYNDKLDTTGQDYLGRMRKSARQMAMMIDDILKFSRSTRIEMHKEVINISEYVNLALAELQKSEPGRKCSLDIEQNISVHADAQLARIVIQNLVENAWKFSAKNSTTHISFGRHNKNTVQLYLKDNGVGFDMKFAEKLFKPFQRLHSATEFKGSGIGLATVYRILNRHGGAIKAESEIGGGTVFYFHF